MSKAQPAILRLMRPKQWVKNAFVFAPLLFSGLFTDWLSVQHTLAAFVIFCLASSATYILNDFNDIFCSYGGAKMNKNVWKQLLSEADKNCDGTVSEGEFTEAMKTMIKKGLSTI